MADNGRLMVVQCHIEMAELIRDTFAVAAPHLDCSLSDSPEAALIAVREEPYDVMITCVDLPGMSGLDLIRGVRVTHDGRQLPIVVVSSLIDHDITWPVYQAGANAWVAKPFDTDVLVNTILSFVSDPDPAL